GFPQIVWQNATRSFKPQEMQARAGDPQNYLSMARSIDPKASSPKNNIPAGDFLAKVPYRK
ncbi:MAG: phycobilisome rod-core linker polypeptide CpcG, partial [Pegethrix bostrychoides GSE-TBD4-15B]|nr:phycobilisome rod-core linker polypeptide CpcG [Pegethrix bostrychoides GSE-TBD4-15B]